MADRYSPHQIPLAIVGMACRLPGADNLEQYWQMLVGGGHAVSEMPADRFDQDMYFDPEVGVRGKTYSKLAATLSSRAVDLSQLPIDPKLAASVDGAHLLMCDVAAAALRHAGLDPFNVPLRNTGVYVGHAQGTTLAGDHTYSTCMAEAAEFLRQVPAFQSLPPHEQQAVIDELIQRVRAPLPHPTVETPDVSASLVAGAINKAFGLNGPYVAINSACASSLQAMLIGARQLQLGRVDMAIVGGASDCKSDSLVLFSNARAMSSTGTRPFDADADGLIVGEGYVALVMKTLKRALDDGDKVWAVVRGLGVSSDGKGKSLWAPRKEGQTKAMERAYRDGLYVADLDYVEAHATATKLGDATELNTLKGILGPAFPEGKKIPITSVKANIGHTLETAGIAGVIKAVLAINNETVPPAINIKEFNPNIDWANSPVYVPTSAQPWPKRADGKPRRAGCNAFGIGGLNMHVAVDEYLDASRALAAAMPGPPQDMLSADEQAIAVIGLGCVLPGAENPQAFWNLLSSGVDPKGPIPADRWNPAVAIRSAQGAALDPTSLVGGFVHGFEYDWKRHKVPPKQVQQADPLQFMLLEASDQAMKDAGYDAKPFNRENVGVVVGTEFGGDFSFQLQLGLRIPELERHIEALLTKRGYAVADAKQAGKDYAEAMLKAWPALIDETGSFSTSSLASRIGKTWNLMGGAAAIDAGQSSGLAALSISVDMLLARDCDMMICAAGQRRMGWPMYESLALSGDLANGSPRSPLDAGAAGCVPGEGVVVLLLKRLADAQRDGDRIHAILRGVGAAHDHNSWGKALELAMERSFGPTVKPSDVAVMELDALSDPATTAEEIRAVASIHGRDGRQHPLMISSVLSQLGNTQGASSLVSMLKAILEVSHGELPPPIGLQTPSTAIKQQDGLLAAPTARTAIDYTTADGRRLAAVGTCSRGLAYHAVLEYGSRVEVKRPLAAAAPQAQPVAAPAPASSSVDMASQIDTAELEKFLVNFVVEQTGYPPEVVELDADLEADLGIDSIKKAQMFGELQEYFDVTPTEGLTLDDFPTLRHIVSFLAKSPTKAGAPGTTAASAPQPAPAPAPAPAAAFNGAAAYQNGAAHTANPSEASVDMASSIDNAELEKFLVNFVVEQTGYPPEVVELDADLEADLGIDSIKKAQMFGELQEYFDVTPTDGLTLDDFPTLRHIVNFLAKAPTKAGAPGTTAATASQPAATPAVAVAPAPVVAASRPQTAPTVAASAAVAAPAGQWQICRFGAADPATLRALATSAQSDPSAFAIASGRNFAAGDRFRLAIVADNVSTLTSRLATALKQLDNPASQTVLEQQGIFYREANPNTRIAFLFPGQGSQYAGMLKQLVADVPAAARQQAEIDATMLRLGYPSWPMLAWDEASPLGKDVWTTQISMLLADVLMLAALRERGIEPDLVAGHSYGEYPALFAAGAWNLEQAIRVTRRRCESIDAQPGGQTGMLATTATPEMIESLTPRLSGPAYVANHNAPDQTVVGGTLPALAELEALLQQSLFETRKLQVPSAFHTPLMRPAGEMFQRAIAAETFTQPRVTTYSVANNEIVGQPGEIGRNLVAHLTTPVRYADLVRKLSAQAPTVFVEVGPQQALTRLNRRILPPQELAGIACDNPSRPGIEQVIRVQAMLECSGALDRPRGQQPVAPAAPAATASSKRGEIFHFDATARRRDKMRAAATKTSPATRPAPQGSVAPPKSVAPPTPVAPPVAAAPVSPAPKPVPVAAAPAPAPVVSAPQPPAKPVTQAAAQPAASVNMAELEKFLVNFVVEQTGYPPEVVELDADLEADLGIDSIKKAQMFGELQEYFDVTPTDGLTLDDFPTLRHIVNFLAKAPTKAGAPITTAASSPQPVPTPAPAPAPAPAVSAAPSQAEPVTHAATQPTVGVDTSELEQFLVNFVVEQTGYPPEVVELDADLEADLGIDSIKKAQMFGELQEYFDVTPTENLTLDDFPTLRHIVNFLAKAPTKAGAPVSTAPSTPQPEVVAAAPAPAPAPAPAVSAAPPQAESATHAATQPTAGVDTTELEAFLVNFVVEQTGYPPEVVELDADLEADLGIDSIKKAQMFGELQEYFDVTPTDNLTLDDFPTLRHIVNFLAKAPTKAGAPVTTAAAPAAPSPAAETSTAGIAAASSAQVDVLHVRGTAYELGFQQGAEKKTEIRRLLRRVADLTDGDWSELPIPAEARTNPERYFTPTQLAELRGLADAVEVPLGSLAALNLAVLPDFAASAAQVALVTTAGGKRQVLHGLAGELSLPPALAEMLTPLILVREPAQGWACATVTFAGIIGSLVGLNGNGLAASTGTLVDTAAATNGSASSMAVRVDGILQRSGSIEVASRGLQQTHATRGWTACLSDQRSGRLATAEHDGRNYIEQPSADLVIAANHCVLSASSQAVPEASLARFNWLRSRLASGQQPQDAGALLGLLGEVPGSGSLKLAVVVDASQGDLLVACGSIRQRVHIGALLPSTPAGDPSTLDAPPAPSTKKVEVPTSHDLQEPAAVDPHSMRFVLRMVPTAWEKAPAEFPVWKGAVAIQGSNSLADALANRIAASGATVIRLRETTSTDAALAELEALWQQQPVTHLFLTALRDGTKFDRSNPADFARIYEERMMLPYFLCQKQMHLAGNAKRISDCTVTTALDLGGDMGFSGNVASPESGFYTGLMKSLLLEYQIMREQKGFMAKAIDAPPEESPEELAANICRELAHGTNDYELSFVGGRRYLQVALPVAAQVEQASSIQPGGVWVLTGGARGITAECGMTLAKRFGLKLHLIGTTPAGAIDSSWRDLDEQQTAALRGRVIIEARKNGQKPNEAWARVEKAIEIDRNLRAFTAAGVSATYHACDVSNREALAQVLDAVRRQDGPISGILHGAGIEQSCRFEKKTPQSVRATVGSKALGAYHLMDLTHSDPITHFLGFGSISGRLGSNGQTDYSAASDMLCKLTSWYRRRRPEVHAVGFHFHPWDGAGMAARPDTEAILKASNLRLMPMQTGIQHLLRELYSKSADTELMITDWEYHQRYYGTGFHDSAKRNDLIGAPGQPLPQASKAVAAPASSAAKSAVKQIADRTLMRMVDAPLSGAQHPLPPAVILLGNNVGADALAQTLDSRGVRVDRLTQLTDHAAACLEVEKLLEANPSRCLIVATARDPQATQLGDRASAQQRTERGIYLPYWVIRRWYQIVGKTPEAGQATVVALTSLGGEFGFSGPVPAPEGGSFTGLLKSIFVEDGRYNHDRFRVKVIDAPVDEPATQLAEAVCQELTGGAPEVEVAWHAGRRRVVKVSREPVERLPLGELPRGGVWVVTGGARGITAATAIELGKRYGLKLHLLGKSPAPEVNPPWRNCSDEQLKAIKTDIVRKATQEGRSPTDDWDRVRKDREIQESLDKFTAAGVTATYHQCDVADWDDVDRVLKNVRAADGPISGIVHGAGYAKSFRFGTGVGNKLEATIAPKVDGTLALMQLTAADPLKYFVGFGSLSGRFGGNGLSDYAAANDALAKLCGWFRARRPECHTVCFHWQTWDAVGMALLADGVGITKNAFKMDFISPEEGVNHLIDELRAGAPESEVLVTDGFFQRQFYPYEMEIAAAAATPSRVAISEPAHYGPLIAAWEPKSVASGIARIKFDPERDPFLSEHRLRQKPFLPGVVGLESLAEAARCALGRDTVMEIRGARITNGMSFPSGPLEARVEVTPVEGGLQCRLLTEQRDRKGRLIDANRLHVAGIVPAGVDSSPIVCDPPGRPPLGWFPHQYPDDGLMYHGRGLRYLTGCAYQFDGGWGRITAPDLAELGGERGGEGWTVPISVLDACVVACGGYLFMQFGGVIEVPYEFERLRIARLPRAGEACIIRLFFRERGEKYSRFDFTLFGDGDEPLLQVDGYRTVRVGGR